MMKSWHLLPDPLPEQSHQRVVINFISTSIIILEMLLFSPEKSLLFSQRALNSFLTFSSSLRSPLFFFARTSPLDSQLTLQSYPTHKPLLPVPSLLFPREKGLPCKWGLRREREKKYQESSKRLSYTHIDMHTDLKHTFCCNQVYFEIASFLCRENEVWIPNKHYSHLNMKSNDWSFVLSSFSTSCRLLWFCADFIFPGSPSSVQSLISSQLNNERSQNAVEPQEHPSGNHAMQPHSSSSSHPNNHHPEAQTSNPPSNSFNRKMRLPISCIYLSRSQDDNCWLLWILIPLLIPF